MTPHRARYVRKSSKQATALRYLATHSLTTTILPSKQLSNALSILHDQLMQMRISGALEATGFIAALCTFDSSLTESAAAAIYVDCALAAAEEAVKGKAASSTSEHQGGVGLMAEKAAAASAHENFPLEVFLKICRMHGVERR